MQVAKAAAVKADINVTPLVDVCLVLLIIFMVITPMLQKGPPVKLPQTQEPPKKPEDEDQILVAIGENRLIWIESDKKTEPIAPEGFAELLGCDGLIVDPQPASLVDGDQDSASLVALRVRFRRVRQVDVGSLPHLRRHHHEDDQQHQHHVNKRRDVDGRLHLASFTESHRPGPPS